MSVSIAKTVVCEGKVVISTLDENVLGSPMPGADESEYPLRSCNHEEFNTRVMLHAMDAVLLGFKRILIIANDIDIIVLGISFFGDKLLALTNCGFNLELETNCGTFQFMTSAVGPTVSYDKAKALPAFHALTGSDNTSFFSGT